MYPTLLNLLVRSQIFLMNKLFTQCPQKILLSQKDVHPLKFNIDIESKTILFFWVMATFRGLFLLNIGTVYFGMMVVNNALFPWGVVALGVPLLDSHDEKTQLSLEMDWTYIG